MAVAIQNPTLLLDVFVVTVLALIANGVHHYRPGRSAQDKRDSLPAYYLRMGIIVVISIAGLFGAYALDAGVL